MKRDQDEDVQWEYQFYPTPPELAAELVALADIGPEDIVLEPSAGQGGLLREIAKYHPARIECCELMFENRVVLREQGWEVVGEDFLALDTYARYTRIVANPPFSNDQDMRHVRHMYALLGFGGVMVVVMSAKFLESALDEHRAFREWLEARQAIIEPLGVGAFDAIGVDVATTLVMIGK